MEDPLCYVMEAVPVAERTGSIQAAVLLKKRPRGRKDRNSESYDDCIECIANAIWPVFSVYEVGIGRCSMRKISGPRFLISYSPLQRIPVRTPLCTVAVVAERATLPLVT
jgi:hypothetical protein